MSKIAPLVIGAAVMFVVLLDYAALDDITTGSQPHFYAEYAMLAVSVMFFAALSWGFALRRRLRQNQGA